MPTEHYGWSDVDTSVPLAYNPLYQIQVAKDEIDATMFTIESEGGGVSPPFLDSDALIKGSADATKLLRFEVDGFTTATTRVLTPPNYDGTIATVAGTETFTNKTLTDPVFNNDLLINSGGVINFNGDGITITHVIDTFDTLIVAPESGQPGRLKVNFPYHDGKIIFNETVESGHWTGRLVLDTQDDVGNGGFQLGTINNAGGFTGFYGYLGDLEYWEEGVGIVLQINSGEIYARRLTSNGFLKTSSGNGKLVVDTSTYLTGNQTITLTGDVTGSGATSIATSIAAQNSAFWRGKVTDETGSGAWVFNDTPTLITPVLGVASGTSLNLSGNLTVGGNVAGHLIPSATDTYDLGSSTLLWRKGWLSEMDAVLFAQNTISVIGGWLIVTKDEGTVEEDVDTSETQIDFGANNIVANDFIVFRAAGAVEYMQATSLVSGTTWNVTRNVDGSGANAWPQGSVWVNFGYNGTGRIELNANSTPRISLFSQGTTYNSQTELLRVGDLNGGWGYSAELYGFATGQYGAAGKAWETIEPTNGIRLGVNTTTLFKVDTSGNVTLGEVATNQGNVFWNTSNKRLEFRGSTAGTVVQAYIDTTGAFTAGGVTLDASGLSLTATGTSTDTIKFRHSGTTIGSIATSYTANTIAEVSIKSQSKAADTAALSDVIVSALNDQARGIQLVLTSGGSASGDNNCDANLYGIVQTFRGLRIGGTGAAGAMLDVVGGGKFSGTITAGSGPTTLTDSAGKILSAALNTVATAQGGTGRTTAWTSGEAVLGSSFTLNGSNGTYQDTGLSVTLPEAGTYIVTADVRVGVDSGTGSEWYTVAKLYNSSDSANVANSETVLVSSFNSLPISYRGPTISITKLITVAASKTIKLYVFRSTNGSFGYSAIESDVNGRTRMTYRQIS